MYPILFHVPTPWGVIPIYSYGVMLGLSLIAAWYLIMSLGAKKEGLDRELMANCFILTAIAGLLGSRVLYIVTNPSEFSTVTSWFSFRTGGLVAYGGFIGGFLGSYIYLRIKKVPLLAWADVVAPALGLGLMFTRVGCWLYGCDFGTRLGKHAPSWLASLGTFPKWQNLDGGRKLLVGSAMSGSPPWLEHVQKYGLPDTATASFPVHPTQLYAAVAGLAIFGLALYVWKHRTFRGQVLFTVVSAYAVWRFLIEYIRDDPERGFAFGFSTSQLISMVLLPVAVIGYVVVRGLARDRGETPIPSAALAVATGDGEEGPGNGPVSGTRRRVSPARAKKRARRKG